MKINEITLSEDASGGATSAGAIATTPMGKGKKKKNVGTLFGGSYKQVNEAKDESSVIVGEIVKLISDGHTEVAPDVITAKVSAAVGRPFMLKDLVAANNSSPELQHYIDSINPSKIKFSTDILTVKNEDPMKEKEQSQAAVSAMASRAAGRDRLGESKSIAEALNDVDDARVTDIHNIVTGQKGHKGRSIADKISDLLLGSDHKNASAIIKYLRKYGLSDGEISQVRDIANQAGKAALDYVARKYQIDDKWLASDLKGNFIVYMPYLNAGEEAIDAWRNLTNKIMLPKLKAQLGDGSYVPEAISNGPAANDPRRQQKGPIPQVKHGAVRSDPAKIDYAMNTQGMTEPIRQAKKTQAAQRKAEKARAERAGKRESKAEMLASIARKIESVVGQVVPDGDPIDYLAPYLNRMGIDSWDNGKWLDAAAKKHLGYKNYTEYLAAMWDMYNDVARDGEDQEEYQNPWR